jgi:hypothetical protein
MGGKWKYERDVRKGETYSLLEIHAFKAEAAQNMPEKTALVIFLPIR